MAGTPDPGREVAHRIAALVTWADIGARDGKTGKVAKRDAKRLARKTSAAARLKANASRGVVLRFRPMSSEDEQPACKPKPGTQIIRIRGLAERAGSPEQPLGPEVIVPESVPLNIQSDPRAVVGTAVLRRDEQGIWAEAEIRLDAGTEHDEAMRRDHPGALWPKLAVGVANALSENGVITSGRVVSVSLVRENLDPDLPPWEVVTDPPGECDRCGGTLEYRDRFLRRDRRWTSDKVPEAWCPHCENDMEHLYVLTHDLRFCGCGDPESVYDLVRDLLGLFAEKWADDGEDHWRECSQKITDRIGGGEGVYYAVLYLIDGAGLIEHGTSVRSSWLTAKGKHCLSLMRLHDYRDMEGPGGLIVGFPHHDPDKPWDDPSQGVCGPGCRHWEASTEEWDKREVAKQAKP